MPTFSIRLDEGTKESMEEICRSLGISMSSAFAVFAKAFVRCGGFPFDVRVRDPMEAFEEGRRILRERFPEEPSLEEINDEITRLRRERDNRPS